MEDNKDEAKGQLHPSQESENKKNDAYGNLVRGLTPEELSQSGTQKLILNDLSKAELRVKELSPYLEGYYNVLTEKSVLAEKLAKAKRGEVLFSCCTISGGIIIGLGKMLITADSVLAAIVIGIGILLIIGGLIFKFK